jgi:hypothetical protein
MAVTGVRVMNMTGVEDMTGVVEDMTMTGTKAHQPLPVPRGSRLRTVSLSALFPTSFAHLFLLWNTLLGQPVEALVGDSDLCSFVYVNLYFWVYSLSQS